jgi:hypothetical protein
MNKPKMASPKPARMKRFRFCSRSIMRQVYRIFKTNKFAD